MALRPDLRIAARVLSSIGLLLLVAPPARSDEAPRAEQKPPAHLYYTGIPVIPITGRTVVRGARELLRLEPVLQGDQVRHDFLIRNDRAEPIELHDVKACEGCILTGYSEEIAPGAEGRISILIVTDSMGGQTISGTVRAETTDPDRPEIQIYVRLEVELFARVEPYRVWLEGRVGEKIVATCTVTPSDRYSFDITGIKTRKGVWFDVAYRKIEDDAGRRFEITLTNTRTRPGSYQDVLYVQTTSPDRPELKIRVEGRLEE